MDKENETARSGTTLYDACTRIRKRHERL